VKVNATFFAEMERALMAFFSAISLSSCAQPFQRIPLKGLFKVQGSRFKVLLNDPVTDEIDKK
jgi:hypothetical protein